MKANKKSSPDFSLRLASEKPWQDSDDDKDVREYIQRCKSDYYEAEAFKRYKKRCEANKYMINHLWENGKKSTKFGFRLSMMQAAYDNLRDSLHDLFDLDEWVYLTAINRSPEQVKYIDELQAFINNMLVQSKYKRSWMRRLDYLPDYGWSPAFADFEYSEGYQLRSPQSAQASGGLPFDAAWSTIFNRPVSRPLNPYSWFTSSQTVSSDFAGQGFIKRWYLRDVYAAEKKKNKDGHPVYNPKAISQLKEMLGKKQQKETDQYNPSSRGNDINDQETSFDLARKEAYVDVTYFHGNLSGCKGYYDDPSIYVVEATKSFTLRMAEDPLGHQFEQITHAKTHAFRSNPFSRTMLDPTREHQRIADLLLNLSIENQVDSMHRFWWLNEDDLLDTNDFYNPRGLNTFLLAARDQAQPPKLLGDNRSGALQDLQQIWGILDHDQQKAGTTDQDAGLGGIGNPFGNGGANSSTATEASILKSASSKKLRAMCKRISEDALIPEIKFMTTQAILFYSPEQLKSISKDGNPLQMTPEHWHAFLTNADMRVNDRVTRDFDAEALKSYNFWTSALKFSQQLSNPDTAVKIIRGQGKQLGIEDLDDILPAPSIPQIPGTMAVPGMPGQVPPAMGQALGAPPTQPPMIPPPQPMGGQPNAMAMVPQAA